MKKFTKIVSLLLACVMMLTMLTACGGSSGGNSGSSGYPATGSVTTTNGTSVSYSKNFSEKGEFISGANTYLKYTEYNTLTADSSLDDKAVDVLNALVTTGGTDTSEFKEALAKKGLDYNKAVYLVDSDAVAPSLTLAGYVIMLKQDHNVSVSKVGMVKVAAEGYKLYVGYLG